MKIADFFVNLTVKGGDKAKKETEGVKDQITGLRDNALAAKAALAAVFYAIQQATASSAQWGMSLKQFGAETGLSAEMLQKWQQAALDFGVGAEDVEGSVRGIQSAIAQMRLGLGVPLGLDKLMVSTGLTDRDLDDPFKVMRSLQKFTKMGRPDIVQQLVNSMHVNPKMLGFLRQYSGDVDALTARMSQRQIDALSRVDVAWAKLGFRLKGLAADFTSNFGMGMVKEIADVLSAFMKLISLFNKLTGLKGEMILFFTAIGLAIQAAFGPIGLLITALSLLVTEAMKAADGKDNIFSSVGKWMEKHGLSGAKGSDPSVYGGGDPMKSLFKGENPAIPAFKIPSADGDRKPNSISIQQTFQGTDMQPQDVSRATEQGINEAFWQLGAITQNA